MGKIQEICRITAKGQTTVPKSVRQALGVGYGGRIVFEVSDAGVTVHATPEEDHEDPALAPFLALLEADIVARPEALVPLSPEFIAKMKALADEIGYVDPEEIIVGEVDL